MTDWAFNVLICGRAWILVPKVLTIMIFQLQVDDFQDSYISRIYMMADRENTCFLLFEKLMSHLESRSLNKSSVCAVIMSTKEAVL